MIGPEHRRGRRCHMCIGILKAHRRGHLYPNKPTPGSLGTPWLCHMSKVSHMSKVGHTSMLKSASIWDEVPPQPAQQRRGLGTPVG